ncbi:unnamed protein product [Rotaria socialis]|uniref:Uncharacterized protein n=1 Tax=Rotaria socialis TaxID=392032 RepID=A0A820I197_9BILA|nr:unnamed protein product [Rotaria socialis]CAF3673813.1 unnamed protein product [Rotaria socialis]CAF4303082.1 unnamed protein product [Rotaria socialis]CAF4653757.1 unnamed protein product [Rotaria socialis]
MPLSDVDSFRRRCSLGLPIDKVDFILYMYNESSFEERHYQFVGELLNFLETQSENDNQSKEKYCWIEVINGSSIDLPNNIKILCEYFNIHSLTVEHITTLAPYMTLNLFHDTGALHLVMKMLTWNGERVQQQQISFYLKCSQNLLITFQDQPRDDIEPFFQIIRNRLRQQRSNDGNHPHHKHNRLRELNVDYLLYCLLDDIIDRYMFVMEVVANRINEFDELLMSDTQSRSLTTLHSIFNVKHDLLHSRMLLNPLKEIIYHLQRTRCDDYDPIFPLVEPTIRPGKKHHIVRRPVPTVCQLASNTSITRKSVYLNDLKNHVNYLIDSLEIQQESVLILISFWMALTNNETQATLKTLMLIIVLFMPCLLLIGCNSTNFSVQPQLHYQYSYFIVLSLLATILSGMIAWYTTKGWIQFRKL